MVVLCPILDSGDRSMKNVGVIMVDTAKGRSGDSYSPP